MPRRPRIFPFEGVNYRSEYERRQAIRLTEAGVNFEYETKQIQYTQSVYNAVCMDCGSSHCHSVRLYSPDFYFPQSGIFVETKGKFDAPSRTKMIDVCNQSEEDIRMVFMRDNWLTRKHGMKYSRWCELKGIEYAIGDIPLSWAGKS